MDSDSEDDVPLVSTGPEAQLKSRTMSCSCRMHEPPQQGSPVWTDVWTLPMPVDVDGDLLAKNLRTARRPIRYHSRAFEVVVGESGDEVGERKGPT